MKFNILQKLTMLVILMTQTRLQRDFEREILVGVYRKKLNHRKYLD